MTIHNFTAKTSQEVNYMDTGRRRQYGEYHILTQELRLDSDPLKNLSD